MMDFQYIIDYYEELPFLIQLAWVLSIAMTLLIVSLIIYLKILRTYLRRKEHEINRFKNQYEAMLVEYLYSGTDDSKISAKQESIIKALKEDILTKSKRKIIISSLYNLMNEVSGEMAEDIKILYYETGLITYAKQRLKSDKWHIIAKGIGELTRFQIHEVQNKITTFQTNKHREVRKQAFLYLVNLFRFKGLTFLNEIKTPLSEWDQINMIEILQKFDDQQICDIKPWLKSSNDTVVIFALKLAQIYNQFEVKDVLMDLLSHDNKIIRINTIEVLTHLYGIEAKDKLKANFEELSLEEQLSFFGLLEKLVIPSDEPFVEEQLFHKDFEIQLLALKILKSINIEKFKVLETLPIHKKSDAMLKFVNTI